MPVITTQKYPQPVNFSLNPVPVKLFGDDTLLSIFVIKLLVEMDYLSDIYGDQGTFIAFPDDDDLGFFDFGGNIPQESILHSFFSGFDFPAYNTAAIAAYSQSIRRFKLNYKYYDLSNVLQDFSTTSAFHILMGGVQWQEFPGAGFWHYKYPDDPEFLTWHPNNKYVTTAQQEYLAYFTYDAITNLKRYFKIYYTDGTDETQHDSPGHTTVQNKMYLFPAGHDQMALDTYTPAKTILKYDIWLQNQVSAVVSDVRTYWIDRSYQPHERFFVFRNSIGGFDTLRTTGTGATSLTHQQTIVQRTLDYRYKVIDGQRVTQNITEQETKKVSSGFKTFAEADFYREMLLSPMVCEDVRGRWTPVEIIRKTFKIYEDDDMLFYVEFEYNYRFINPVYGNEKINSIAPGFSEASDNADFPH